MTERRRHRCDQCGWETLTPADVRVVFHPCRPAKRRRRLEDWLIGSPLRDEQLERERQDWFTSRYPTPPEKK